MPHCSQISEILIFPKEFSRINPCKESAKAFFVILESGTFFPQNAEYSNTSKLVRMIAAAHGKKLGLWHGFTGLLKFMSHLTPLVDKAFGNLSYDMSMSDYPKGNYRLYSLEESIRRTEGV